MKRLLFGLSLVVLAALLLAGCGTGEAVRGTSLQCKGWSSHCSNLLEGESKDYQLGGNYKITLKEMVYQDYAGGIHSATFNVNGKEVSLLEGEEKTLSTGKVMKLTEMVYQSYAGGIHSATFCISN